MRAIKVRAEREYSVLFAGDWLEELASVVDNRRTVFIAPALISEKIISRSPKAEIITVPDGEAQKSIASYESVIESVQERGLDRSSVIVGIGGGATTDLAGFVAATYLRGIEWIAIPTTIAGMVDAAIGGKTGVNLKSGKNLAGSFHSPSAVIVDESWIDSLPLRDQNAGLVEALKCGFIADPVILDRFQDAKLNLGEIIFRAIAVKASVVTSDFRESFEREALNYGHTLGHAIERHSNYLLRHGEAIALGMVFAAELSNQVAGLATESVALHRTLLARLDAPTQYRLAAWEELYKIMGSDKKRRGARIRFVTLPEIGKTDRDDSLDEAALKSVFQRSVGR